MKCHHQALLVTALCCAAALPFLYGPTSTRESASSKSGSTDSARSAPIVTIPSKTFASSEIHEEAASLSAPMRVEAPQPTHFQSPIEIEGSRLTTNSKNSAEFTPYYSPVPALAEDAGLENQVEITVPAGARLPAALLQSNEGLNLAAAFSSAQQKLADHLAMEFAREVAQDEALDQSGTATGTAQGPDPGLLSRWRNHATKSDERFRSLFGYDAYNRESLRKYQSNEENPTNIPNSK